MASLTQALHREALLEMTSAAINQQRFSADHSAISKSLNSTQIPQHESLDGPERAIDLAAHLQRACTPCNKRFAHSSQEKGDQTAVENEHLSQVSASSGKPYPDAKIKRYVGPWQLGEDLGKGMSCRVRKAQHYQTGQLAAVKIIDIRKAATLQTASVIAIDKKLRSAKSAEKTLDSVPTLLQREIVILKATQHPNIIKLFDVWENRGELYLFTEYVENGELLHYIIKHGYLDEEESVRILRQIVSGLQYCHRFLFCHRDLKPENILLDHDYNVKLADFGLAAMQHDQLLRTSCGSPHYAAPELLRGQPYRGNLADTWSCGVILFVMMCGKVPFGGEYDVDRLAKLCNAVLYDPLSFSDLPGRLSDCAIDLIRKFLERNPSKRITLSEVWKHPLLIKYELIALQPKNRSRWLGGSSQSLTVEDCGPQLRDVREIDKAAVRGLCILWQTDDENRLVRALLGNKPCYEKVLYQRLSRYRMEQEENFHGPILKLSSSDYHYLPPPYIRSRTKNSLLGPGSKTGHSSEFSLVPPTNRRPSIRSRYTDQSGGGSGSGSRRARSSAETETTYDPYRSSKPQVIYRGSSYTKISIYRDVSVNSKARSSPRRRVASHPPVSSVWESTVGSSPTSMASSPPELPGDANGRHRVLRHTTVRKHISKSSLSTSIGSQASSLSISFRRSSSYKRNVSFRRPSDCPTRPSAPTPMSEQQRYLCDHLLEETPELSLSPGDRKRPAGVSMPLMVKTPVGTGFIHPHRAGRLVQSNASICDAHAPYQAAVKAGNELSEYCDAAFSSTPATPEPALPVELQGISADTPTPITGLENAALLARLISTGKSSDVGALPQDRFDKALPEVPMKEPHALQMQRMLAKALQNLKERDKEIGKGMLDGAMAEIERVMKVNAPGIATDNYHHRVASTHGRRISSDANNRPISNFAVKLAQEAATEVQSGISWQKDRRYFSDPLPRAPFEVPAPSVPIRPSQTIRLVPKSPAIYPPSASNLDVSIVGGVAADHAERVNEPRVIPRRRDSKDFSKFYTESLMQEAFEPHPPENRLQTIQEIDDHENEEGQSKRNSGSNRFKSWFRRSNGSVRSLEKAADGGMPTLDQIVTECNVYNSQASTSRRTSAAQDFDAAETWQNGTGEAEGAAWPIADPSRTTTESEFPSRGEGQKAVKALFSFFRRSKQPGMRLVELSDIENLGGLSIMGSQRCSTAYDSTMNVTSPDGPSPTHPPIPWPGMEREPSNWLARLLQIRPATRAFAFDATFARVLREIRNILRTWRKYGVRDVILDRGAGRIWARLNDDNGLGIRPVEIMFEVYGVVYSNRLKQRAAGPAGMAVARMQQIRGARSSFERCADHLVAACKERGLLVLDRKKAREMKKCLNCLRR